jgi:hypothetical protein
MFDPRSPGSAESRPRPKTIVAVAETAKNLVDLGPTFARNSRLAAGLRDLSPGAIDETKRIAPPNHPIAEMM